MHPAAAAVAAAAAAAAAKLAAGTATARPSIKGGEHGTSPPPHTSDATVGIVRQSRKRRVRENADGGGVLSRDSDSAAGPQYFGGASESAGAVAPAADEGKAWLTAVPRKRRALSSFGASQPGATPLISTSQGAEIDTPILLEGHLPVRAIIRMHPRVEHQSKGLPSAVPSATTAAADAAMAASPLSSRVAKGAAPEGKRRGRPHRTPAASNSDVVEPAAAFYTGALVSPDMLCSCVIIRPPRRPLLSWRGVKTSSISVWNWSKRDILLEVGLKV